MGDARLCAAPTMRRIVHWIACVAFVATLCLPLVQTVWKPFPVVGLGGVVKPVAASEASLASWNEGKLQIAVEDGLRRELGLRDWMIRADNELRMRAFGSAKRPIVAGDDGWLLEEGYLPTRMLARNHALVEELLTRTWNFRLLQDALAKHGVHLAAVISPSKVWTYPELVPSPHREAMHMMASRFTLPEVVRAGLDVAGARRIDFGEQFREWRQTDAADTPPLFPRGGIHWSNHAAARAAMRIQGEMEAVARADFRTLEIERVAESKRPGGGEDDLVLLSNLLDTSRWEEPIGQPMLRARQGDAGAPMPTLIVGSSFSWGLARSFASDRCAEPLAVWYYFKSEWPYVDGKQQPASPLPTAPEELKERLLRYEVVLVECNESAAEGFGMGFVEKALEALGIEPAKTPPTEFMQRIEQRARAAR